MREDESAGVEAGRDRGRDLAVAPGDGHADDFGRDVRVKETADDADAHEEGFFRWRRSRYHRRLRKIGGERRVRRAKTERSKTERSKTERSKTERGREPRPDAPSRGAGLRKVADPPRQTQTRVGQVLAKQLQPPED